VGIVKFNQRADPQLLCLRRPSFTSYFRVIIIIIIIIIVVVGVYLFVALEDRGGDEGLLTQVTLVLLVSVVHHLDVHVQRVLPLEGGVALVALEGALACGGTEREDRSAGSTLRKTDRRTYARTLSYCRV